MSTFLEFLNVLSATGLMAVLNTLWQELAVVAVLWCVLRLMPGVNAATRHAVWWAVLALVVLMPFATLLSRHAPVPSSAAPAETQSQPRALYSSPMKPLADWSTRAPAPALSPAPLPVLESRSVAVPHALLPFEFDLGNWPSGLLFFWIAACGVLFGRIAYGYLRLRGVRNRAQAANADLVARFEQHLRNSHTSRAPQLLMSHEVISPLAAGFLHPVVILPHTLPEELTDPELDCVLLHELAHVARRDDWTNLMGRLASAVLAFHPVAAWVLRRIQREREIACDDWVVAATGSAASYAFTLGRIAEFCSARRQQLLATEMAHRSSSISERIEMLLRPTRFHFSKSASLPRILLCVATGIALLGFSVGMPSWIVLAKDAPAAITKGQAIAESQDQSARMSVAQEPSPVASPALASTLSPAHNAQLSPTSAVDNHATQNMTWRHGWKLTHDSSSSTVQFSLISRDDNGNNRTNTEGVPLSKLSGFSLSQLDHDGPVKFEYIRDAGRIVCEGTVTDGRASGPFDVALDPSFVSALEKMGYAAPRDDDALALVISDVNLGYAQAIRDTGLTSSISDLVELRDHGVKPDYVRAVRQEGFTNLSASNLSTLHDHGVDPKYLKAIKADASDLSIESINSLFDHGVKPDYYKSVRAAAPQLSIEQIDSLFDHGVAPDSYKSFASIDPHLSIEEINSLYDHGVKPEYYRKLKAVDPQLSIEQINHLNDHGVAPESYKGFAAVDPQLSVVQIANLHDHGVEPDFYKGTKAADSKVSVEEIDGLRDHGVAPEYLTEIRGLPDRFSIAEISELRDHGITAKYIRDLHEMGMKNLTAAQIVHLREGN